MTAMNCQDARNLFNTFLDGELSGTLAVEFGAHKLSCPSCRRELALLEVAGHVVAADIDTPLLSDEFTDRLLSIATRRPVPWYRRKRAMLYVGGPLAVAACLALVLVPLFTVTPAPRVLRDTDVVDSPREILEQVETALIANPDNPALQKLADQLRARIDEIAEGTKDGASLFENYTRETIMELLRSIQIDSSVDDDEAPSDDEPSGDDHDPTVEDL
jgi:hypothetical protein